MPELSERVDSLESLLGQFIVHTDTALRRLEREMRDFKDEMKDFKDEEKQQRREMNRKWGELANKMGTLVEDIVAPNISGLANRYFGCKEEELDDFMVRRKKLNTKDPSKKREFDVIAVCGDVVLLNETKSTPRIGYIDDFAEVLKEIYDYFPEYRGKKVIPVFASLYMGL